MSADRERQQHEPQVVTRKDGSRSLAARGYRWEDAKPGNFLALKHGAWSPRKVDPLALELVEAVSGDVEWWTNADQPAVHAWARAEAQCQLLVEYLMAAAEATGDGIGDLEADRVQSAYRLLDRAETRAARLRDSLGLTPLARARLGRDTAVAQVDMARLMAEEHAREQAERAGMVEADVVDGSDDACDD